MSFLDLHRELTARKTGSSTGSSDSDRSSQGHDTVTSTNSTHLGWDQLVFVSEAYNSILSFIVVKFLTVWSGIGPLARQYLSWVELCVMAFNLNSLQHICYTTYVIFLEYTSMHKGHSAAI